MKIFQINSVVNSGSTGRIAEDIGNVLLDNGHESHIAYGRDDRPSNSDLFKIGSNFDFYLHGIKSLFFDRHGFGSIKATIDLIKYIDHIQPDAIGLHNLHGYYINIEILFDYLSKSNIPVLWTLFDCWAFTGHCSYFDDINCIKWKTQCEKCPKTRAYPSSCFLDNSSRNYNDKKRLFNSLNKLEIVVHSRWLAGLVKDSFFKDIKVHVIPSGIDLNTFKPTKSSLNQKYNLKGKKLVLGCANIWTTRKGLEDFILLRQDLSSDWIIVLIGLSKKQLQLLPNGIIGVERTESIAELAAWYSMVDVFVNPTYSDNFPTTNLEALACGTPVITYKTGGSPEAINKQTGIIVEKGNVKDLLIAIKTIVKKGKDNYQPYCQDRAKKFFNKDDQYSDYMNIYNEMVKRTNSV